MAFLRIKDWLNTIAAFRTGDVIPVDGPSGTAKMGKDDLLNVTAENALNKTHTQFYASNLGEFYFEETRTSSGSVFFKSTTDSWAIREGGTAVSYTNTTLASALGVSLVTSPSGVANCIEIESAKVLIVKEDNTLAIKNRSGLSGKDSVVFGVLDGRIVSFDGTKFGSAILDKFKKVDTALPGIATNHSDILHQTKTQLYASNAGKFYLEETRTSNGSIYVKSTTDSWAVRGSSPTPSYTNSTFASSVGQSLVTSPAGVTNCIEIASGKSLVLDSSNAPKIRNRDSVLSSDCLVVSCLGGVAVAFDTRVFGQAIIDKINDENTEILSLKDTALRIAKTQFYAGNGGKWYVEESGSDYVWFKSTSGSYAIRGIKTETWASNDDFATELNRTTETSPKGVTGCIKISNFQDLVIRAGTEPRLVGRDSILATDILVFSNIGGKLVGYDSNVFGQYILDGLRDLDARVQNEFFFSDIAWETKAKTIADNVNGLEECDQFIFFTDPHVLPHTGWDEKFKSYMNVLRKWNVVLPSEFVLCGGDWLQNSDTQAEAITKMGYETAWMQQNFENYHQLVGNHDTNYQGVVSDVDPSSGELSQDTINNTMYNRAGGKSYYEFESLHTKFYCFDSGIDFTATAMSTYQWEQLDWFANRLIAENPTHAVIAIHILTLTSFGSGFDAALCRLLLQVADKFNQHGTGTWNGISYDFTNCTGCVELCIGGHSHADINSSSTGGIPVVGTLDATSNNKLTFDYIVIDYDNKVAKFTRIGQGSDRQFNLQSHA